MAVHRIPRLAGLEVRPSAFGVHLYAPPANRGHALPASHIEPDGGHSVDVPFDKRARAKPRPSKPEAEAAAAAEKFGSNRKPALFSRTWTNRHQTFPLAAQQV